MPALVRGEEVAYFRESAEHVGKCSRPYPVQVRLELREGHLDRVQD